MSRSSAVAYSLEGYTRSRTLSTPGSRRALPLPLVTPPGVVHFPHTCGIGRGVCILLDDRQGLVPLPGRG